jgi:hypothetical protein
MRGKCMPQSELAQELHLRLCLQALLSLSPCICLFLHQSFTCRIEHLSFPECWSLLRFGRVIQSAESFGNLFDFALSCYWYWCCWIGRDIGTTPGRGWPGWWGSEGTCLCELGGFRGRGCEDGARRRREPGSDAGRLRGGDLRRLRHAGRGAGECVGFSHL